jgi:hypothetical protein
MTVLFGPRPLRGAVSRLVRAAARICAALNGPQLGTRAPSPFDDEIASPTSALWILHAR